MPVPLARLMYECGKQSGWWICNEFCVSTDEDTRPQTVTRITQIGVNPISTDPRNLWLWIVFPDFVDDLQLRAKLLIAPETNVVATLKHKLRIDSCQQDFGMDGQ